MLIICPSGLSFIARKWNLSDVARAAEQQQAEENASASDTKAPATNLLLEMAASAVVKVVDSGPYAIGASGIPWAQVTNQDLISALVGIRKFTRPLMQTDITCRHCRRVQPEGVELDLRGLEIYVASPEGIQTIQSGVPHDLKLQTTDGEAVVRIHPVCAKDNNKLAALQREEQARSIEIANCMSVSEIVLPGGARLTALPAIRDFYAQQDWEFGEELDKAVEDLFGGPDTSFVWKCAHAECGMEQRSTLPLDGTFWGLGGRRRKRRKISSATTSPGKDISSSSSPPSSGAPTPLT